ncbi:MAG: MCP four helix bundle domain-containing protein [Pseudomonadota bacterium]
MKKKLFLLLTLGILTLASVGGIGIYAFIDIKQVVSSITEQMIPRIEAAHRLGTIYRDLRLLLLSHINENDGFLKKAFSEKIHNTELEGQEVVEKYETFAKDQTQQKALIDAYKEYIKIHHEALIYSEKNQKDLAEVALYGKALPATTKMEALLLASSRFCRTGYA